MGIDIALLEWYTSLGIEREHIRHRANAIPTRCLQSFAKK